MVQRIPRSTEQVVDKRSHRKRDDNLTISSTLQPGTRGIGFSKTKICLWSIRKGSNIDSTKKLEGLTVFD